MLTLLITMALANSEGESRSVRAMVEVTSDGARLVRAVQSSKAPPARELGEGALEILDDAGLVVATANLKDPLHRSVIFPEGGGANVVLERGVTEVILPWSPSSRSVRLGDVEMMPAPRPPPGAVAVLDNGSTADRLDLVLLGDGYKKNQLDDFSDDVDYIIDYVLTVEPYATYDDLFNVWKIDVESNESGISHTGDLRDTALSCYYSCGGIDRLICCDDLAVLDTVYDVLPDADGILVLINDPEYGGSGGFTYATSYVGQDYGAEVAAHELGHSLVGLWDEYGYGGTGSGDGPNCTADSSGIWDEWLDVPAVDVFAECSYSNLYRPTDEDCMMRTLSDDYCEVCRQEAVLAIYSQLPKFVVDANPAPGTPMSGLEDDPEAIIELTVTIPKRHLTFEWSVDGEIIASDDPNFDVRCSGANGDLMLRVYDDTSYVRSDPDRVLEQVLGPWPVESDSCGPLGKDILACGCAAGPPSAGWLLLLPFVLGRRR